MVNVIVAFPKAEDAKNVRNLLVRNGFSVPAVCTTGAAAISHAENLDDGIIVCGYRFPDMIYSELRECAPPQVKMLLVASPKYWSECSRQDVVTVAMPIKVHDLIATLQMMSGGARHKKKDKAKPGGRTAQEQALIQDAKELLMVRNNMSEEEAHKYIQKCSMDSGTNMVETAQMVLSLMGR